MNTVINAIDRFFDADASVFSTRYINYLTEILHKIDVNEIKGFVEVLLEAREHGATIFFIGNGGSAATACHFANDLGFGTETYTKPFRAISLTDNQASLTALANDFGYEEVFVRQLRVLGKSGDVLVGISASGNSPNLVKAFEYANQVRISTVAITAFDGGLLKQMADQSSGSGFVEVTIAHRKPNKKRSAALMHFSPTRKHRCEWIRRD